jgi:vancomycin permeability regulator SanA
VILGAAVWPGGRPSPALRRRVEAALDAAQGDSTARFVATGAVGRHPPSEARVMGDLLVAAGIARDRVVLEETGTDTLSSLVATARILRRAGARSVFVCSDAYHVPRCRAVLRALGVRSRGAPAHGGRRAVGTARWLARVAREAMATPWDVALAFRARSRIS